MPANQNVTVAMIVTTTPAAEKQQIREFHIHARSEHDTRGSSRLNLRLRMCIQYLWDYQNQTTAGILRQKAPSVARGRKPGGNGFWPNQKAVKSRVTAVPRKSYWQVLGSMPHD